MFLIGVLLLSMLGACATPTVQQGTNETPAPAAPTQTPTTPATQTPVTPEPEAVEMRELGRGVVVATQNEPPSVAPARHQAVAGGFMNDMTHVGLFRVNYSDLEPVPDLVREFRPLSDTLWEFTIHEGVMFHNGDIMTAADVVASLIYVTNYPYAAHSHASRVSVEQTGEYTLVIDTGEPNAALLVDLTAHSNRMMPLSLIEAGHDFTTDPVGAGPFVFQEWQTGEHIHFTAFENFFNLERAANVEYMHWRIIPEGASRTIALETGEVDYVVEVAFPDIRRLQDSPDVEVFYGPGTTLIFMKINNDLPQFNDINVRRAINRALDKESIIEVGLDGFGIPVWSAIPPIFRGHTDEGACYFDPEGARQILAENNIDPATLGFELIVTNDERMRMGAVMQSNMADLGIPVTLRMQDLATTLAVTMAGDYEASFGGFTTSDVLAFIRMYHVDAIGGPNRSRVRNERLSELIDEAFATVDESARIAIIEEAGRVANYHAGTIPLYLQMVVRAFNTNLVVPEHAAAMGSLNLNMVYWRD